ncbi:MAG: hypothetical protein H0T73_09215, partial [Ardenticatenales bacterium]|nr:hypothetical protein [Ardenticatenales bacterium]
LEAIVEMALDSRWALRSFFAAAQRTRQEGRFLPPPAPVPPAPPALLPYRPSRGGSQTHPATPLPLDEIMELLAETGRVAQALPGYESRSEQIAMLSAIVNAFATSSHLLVEAGTGIGKSLAYVIAAIYQATTRNEPVVISTNTLNLQDQLFYDELPHLSEVLGRPFNAVRLKGKNNYLCSRRFELLRRRGNFNQAEARLLARILVWLQRTSSGDRVELNLQPEEEPFWELISADGSSCSPDRCEPYGPCYWLRARALAEQAHLLIVNHALLLTDLMAQGGQLPPYRYLIVDEAHHLEEQATQHFGFALHQERMYQALQRLEQESNGRSIGLLAQIRRAARESKSRDLSALAERCGLLIRQAEQCRRSADGLFECLAEVLHRHQKSGYRYHILPEWRQQAEWRRLAQATELFCADLQQLIEGLGRIEQELRALSFDEPLCHSHADECRYTIGTFDTFCQETTRILLEPENNDINWVTVRDPQGDEEENDESAPTQVILYRAPMTVAPMLHERLFNSKHSVILTSATLSSEGSFTFLRERLGINEANELALGSPYDFTRQALVYVADDLPEPNQPHYASNIHRALIELARATDGRMLVLFTSKSQLNAAYRAISDSLAHQDIVVLGQYMDGSRTQLIERFRTMERAVLLGTHSFWEGIDIPGPALSCLVITRLPFPVPTDPVQATRSLMYSNPFLDYAVPQAVLRFRQGFGRLLRSTRDRGIVALLDSRLESKRYGSTFLNSLPNTQLHIGPFRGLPPLASRWLAEEE